MATRKVDTLRKARKIINTLDKALSGLKNEHDRLKEAHTPIPRRRTTRTRKTA